MTALTVIVSLLVVTLIAFIIFGGAFRLLGWSGFVAFVLSLLLAWSVKYAFIDSWIMVKMMHGYMQVAPTTVITFDLYTKLSNLSAKFREMFRQSGATASSFAASTTSQQSVAVNIPQTPPANATPSANAAPPANATQPADATENKPRFCAKCGTPLQPGKAFCGNCGAKA